MIFFTADLHLGHANIIKHCNRPFSSVEEMDEYLICMWNSRVRSDDIVYILGDLIFRSTKSPKSYLDRLNGKKHLILGNHDTKWIKKVDLTKYFTTVEYFLEISDGQHQITLCHYPLMSWNQMMRGSYMIHGHIHNSRNGDYFPLLQHRTNMLNAGVEINNFQPATFDELIRNNKVFKIENTDKRGNFKLKERSVGDTNFVKASSSAYLVEVRLSGSAKKYVKNLIFDVARTFSVMGVTGKKVVPHITVLGPVKTKNEQRLIQEIVGVCNKYDLMSIKFEGFRTFGNWLFGNRVIGINIKSSIELEQLRSELIEKLSEFCQLSKHDTGEWKPHSTIAFKDIDRKFVEIKKFVESQKVPEIRHYVLRVTLLKGRKILCEYDFLQRKTLNRYEALSRENKRKTLTMLKEKLHK